MYILKYLSLFILSTYYRILKIYKYGKDGHLASRGDGDVHSSVRMLGGKGRFGHCIFKIPTVNPRGTVS